MTDLEEQLFGGSDDDLLWMGSRSFGCKESDLFRARKFCSQAYYFEETGDIFRCGVPIIML